MLYITLKKNFNYKYSYILVIMNNKRKILKKIGVFSYNVKLCLFVLTLDLLLLFFFSKKGVLISPKVYEIMYLYVNRFIL